MGWGQDLGSQAKGDVCQENNLNASRKKSPPLSYPAPNAVWMEIAWIIAGSEAVRV